MNNKIKELAKDHLITSEYTESGSHECRKYEFHPEELDEFVQLIIRECADVAADHDALDIYEEIREYFGIEE